jgi:hypothetical protein
MKAFLLALAGTLVVALAAAAILQIQQRDSAAAYSTESTRLGDPGRNLILDPAPARPAGADQAAR